MCVDQTSKPSLSFVIISLATGRGTMLRAGGSSVPLLMLLHALYLAAVVPICGIAAKPAAGVSSGAAARLPEARIRKVTPSTGDVQTESEDLAEEIREAKEKIRANKAEEQELERQLGEQHSVLMFPQQQEAAHSTSSTSSAWSASLPTQPSLEYACLPA